MLNECVIKVKNSNCFWGGYLLVSRPGLNFWYYGFLFSNCVSDTLLLNTINMYLMTKFVGSTFGNNLGLPWYVNRKKTISDKIITLYMHIHTKVCCGPNYILTLMAHPCSMLIQVCSLIKLLPICMHVDKLLDSSMQLEQLPVVLYAVPNKCILSFQVSVTEIS